MRIINRPRRAGKSTQLVLEAAAKNLQIVCPDIQMCNNLKDIAQDFEVEIIEPITIHWLMWNWFQEKDIVIDEALMCLQSILHKSNIKTISL